MQLTCPHCEQQIAADNINIQQMVAVCAHCDHIFHFEEPKSKSKRRKVRQPQRLIVREMDDHLHLAFRTNFRLDSHEAFLTTAVMSIMLTFATVLLAAEYVAGETPFVIPIGFGLIAAFLYYLVALIVFNKTHIEVEDDTITISRKPLPNPLHHEHAVNISGVAVFRCEETAISKKEAYDTPRYVVWAEMVDGSRKMIVNDVIDDYGYYIAQQLNECLQEQPDADVNPDVSRLDDSVPDMDDTQDVDETMRLSSLEG